LGLFSVAFGRLGSSTGRKATTTSTAAPLRHSSAEPARVGTTECSKTSIGAPSMIERDMDLESELGVDSSKRVEIVSELQALLSVEVKDVDVRGQNPNSISIKLQARRDRERAAGAAVSAGQGRRARGQSVDFDVIIIMFFFV
jgi:acyl carrier protein